MRAQRLQKLELTGRRGTITRRNSPSNSARTCPRSASYPKDMRRSKWPATPGSGGISIAHRKKQRSHAPPLGSHESATTCNILRFLVDSVLHESRQPRAHTHTRAYTHIASLLNPGNLTNSLYSLCTVSTEIHASFDGAACARNGSYGLRPRSASSLSGGGGGVSTCGGAGGGRFSGDRRGGGASLRARKASRSQNADAGVAAAVAQYARSTSRLNGGDAARSSCGSEWRIPRLERRDRCAGDGEE